MKSFATTTTIDASVGSVWAPLTDAPGYPGTVATIEGRIAPGEKVTMRAKASGGRAFALRVSVFEA
jgi:hypothetical protein